MNIAVISAERIKVSRRARAVVGTAATGLSVASIVILQLIEGCRSSVTRRLACRRELSSQKSTRETVGQQRCGQAKPKRVGSCLCWLYVAIPKVRAC
jgi:hypothetical protein